ncbi:MAG: flippase-like domain-containing protein [Methanobacteriota archaeon]
MGNRKKPRNIKLSVIVSVALSITVILVILYLTVDVSTFQYLSTVSLRYEFFVVAVVLSILYWVLWGARLKVLSNAIDPQVRIGWWESTKIVLANLFLASITPSLAGGEPVRIYLLSKDGLSTGSATAVVLGERLIDAIFLLVCLPFAVFILKDLVHVEYLSIGLTIAVIVFIFFVLLFALAIKYPEKTKSFLIRANEKFNRLLKKKNTKKIVNKINREVDNFHSSMVFFLTGGKKAFLGASALTVLMWISGFLIPSMILLGLNLPPVFIQSIAAQVLLVVIAMMPTTPGSTGVVELSFAGLYTLFVESPFIGVFVILFRLITYHMGLLVGAVFQYRIFKSITSFSLDAFEKHR